MINEKFKTADDVFDRWDFKGEPNAHLSFDSGGAGAAYIDFRNSADWLFFVKEPVQLKAGAQYTISARVRRNLGYGGIRLLAREFKENGRNIVLVEIIRRSNEWHDVSFVFVAKNDVQARIGFIADGYSELWIEGISLRRNHPPLPAYQTGLLVRPASPFHDAPYRTGAFFEAEDIIDSPESVTDKDADEDGLWSFCRIDPLENFWLFSEDTVIKSDSRSEEEGGNLPPLKLKADGLLPGRYQVLLSDPGRDAAVSIDGKNWRRVKGSAGEIDLGVINVNGSFNVQVAHRFRTPENPGPVYVDYLRFMPVYDAAAGLERPVHADPLPAPSPVQTTSLMLVNTWGVPRRGELVVAGMPFERGAFWPDDGINISGVTDLHVKPLVFWPDGSVKWLRMEFCSDFAGAGDEIRSVEYGCQVKLTNARKTCCAKQGVYSLRCGKVEIRVCDGIWSKILFNGHEIIDQKPSVRMRSASGMCLDQLLVDSVTVENDGPYPDICVRGYLGHDGVKGPVSFEACLCESAPDTVGLRFYVVNESDERYEPEKGCGLALPLVELSLALNGISFVPAVLRWPTGPESFAGTQQKLIQTGSGRCVADFSGIRRLLEDGSELFASGFVVENPLQKRSDSFKGVADTEKTLENGSGFKYGWVDLRGDGAGLAVGVREFAEKCPKSISVLKSGSGSVVEIGIWPGDNGAVMRYAQGTRLGVDMVLTFHDGALDEDFRDARLASVLDPVRALLMPEYYVRTGVFGPLSTVSDNRFKTFHDVADRKFVELVSKYMSYGIEDWGDFFDGCCYVRTETRLWTNMEWNFIAYLVLDFARSGDPARLECALRAARHFSDIDIIHFSSNPEWTGGSYQHTGGTTEGHQVVKPDFAHAGWPEGLLWVYYMTGDERFSKAASGIAGYVARNMPPHGAYRAQPEFSMWNCKRQAGNPILSVCSVYELTRDPALFDVLNRLVDFTLRVQDVRFGCWSVPFYEEPMYHRPSASWGTDLERGLHRYWELTGDLRVESAFRRLESFLTGVVPPDDTKRYLSADSEFRNSFLFVAEHTAFSSLFSRNPGTLFEKGMKLMEATFSAMEEPEITPRVLPGYITGGLRLESLLGP